MEFYLYRHIRLDKNVPFYVGIGRKTNSFFKTQKSEYKRAFSNNQRNFLWKRIVNITDFQVEIIYESNCELEIKKKEKEFIEIYGRKDLKTGTLCNFTNGGDGRLGATTESLKTNIELLKKRIGKNHPNSKKVFQYDLNGNFVKKHDCISDAMRIINDTTTSGIIGVCKKKYHTYKKFRWFYEYQGKKIDPLPNDFYFKIRVDARVNMRKKVAQINKTTGEIIKIFESTKDIERQLNIPNSIISRACLGGRKSANGFIWKYI